MTGQLKQKKPLPPSPLEALREFVGDIESPYKEGDMTAEEVAEALMDEYDWYDLAETYKKAKQALVRDQRMRHDAKKPLKIKRWIASGELGEGEERPATLKELFAAAGRLLDKSCVHEIFGDVLFEAEDGVLYTMSVKAEIAPASDGCIEDIENLIEEMRGDDQG